MYVCGVREKKRKGVHMNVRGGEGGGPPVSSISLFSREVPALIFSESATLVSSSCVRVCVHVRAHVCV